MEDGADFIVGEKGGFVIERRSHVAADEAEVEAAILAIGGRKAHFEVVHPGTAAFGVARMPVGVEGADVGAFFVPDFVKFDGGVPDLDGAFVIWASADGGRGIGFGGDENGITGGDGKIEDALGEVEHAGEDLIKGEPGAEFFGVEVVFGAALFFSPEGQLPRFEEVWSAVLGIGAELLELNGFFFEGWADAFVEVVDEFQSGATGARHALLEDLICEMLLAEEAGFFVSKSKDLPNERGIVVGFAVADAGGGLPDLLADVFIFEVFENGDERGGFEGEAELGGFRGAEVFGFCLLTGGIDGALGEALEARGVVDDQVPGVGGIEDVLGVLLGNFREFGFDLFEARFFIGLKFGAMLTEAFHGFVEGTAANAGESFGFVCFAVGEKEVPDVGVEGDFRKKGRDGREHGVLGLAQGRVIAEGIEVVDQTPSFIEGASGFVEGQDNAFEGHAATVLGQKRVDRGGGLL